MSVPYRINDSDTGRTLNDKIRRIVDYLATRINRIEIAYRSSSQSSGSESGTGLSVADKFGTSPVHGDVGWIDATGEDYFDIADLPDFEGELADDDQIVVYDLSENGVYRISLEQLKKYLRKRKS